MLTIASFHRHVAPQSVRVVSQLSPSVDDSVKDYGSRTELRSADVDCAPLYDGFRVITFQWLEALGFCEPG